MGEDAKSGLVPNPQPSRFQAWQQVIGLAILLAAVMFTWMIYGVFQPRILSSLGFTALASQLGIYQGLLGAIVEPVVGWKSDQIFRRLNTRFPMVTFGVTLAGLICVSVSVLWQEKAVMLAIRNFVPILTTVWVIAMIIFRGPAIALLRQFTPADFPLANAILTLVFALMGAMSPLVGRLITQWGASATFLLGALSLVVGGLLFKWSQPPLQLAEVTNDPPIPLKKAIAIFWVGLAAGIQSTLLFGYSPQLLHQQIQWLEPAYLTSAILVISAVSALPLEQFALTWGVHRSMLMSFSVIALLLGVLNAPANWLFLVLFGLAFGLLFISQIPYALGAVPSNQAGFGTGLYFGGIGGGSAIVSWALGSQPVSSSIILWGFLATVIGGIGLIGTRRDRNLL
ncbi:major facilitator transporter [Leptolyngbya boryana NIES-2135]|jgi:MFS family permease|uniref:Major facilitator transporter n=1 Tax=Leptolyngbya boryana NIES-2135 TaxID=1973484 RepID=A0A1Z4JQW6_LEPBY|nr:MULTISPECIES: MFS transporter [Leptolyngbya]BAY59116.1 major facilitator transporter [Leptolyngbya boryana NIES-2135]MBD2368136.1 MFS transporter [Leptolyngbya sp. FACHB-161]MBD2374827.1 MFS transporter [Leptolyngbya sp. FACHB-238]MBD2399249.1 MFS transporter [Leptolyngbya sp. FACHB-239]MBD2405254.1 MFS transporter [Leptolyngbya sp. FACHB-402]